MPFPRIPPQRNAREWHCDTAGTRIAQQRIAIPPQRNAREWHRWCRSWRGDTVDRHSTAAEWAGTAIYRVANGVIQAVGAGSSAKRGNRRSTAAEWAGMARWGLFLVSRVLRMSIHPAHEYVGENVNA